MNIEFDPDKNLKNEREHGLRFENVHRLDWDNALYVIDDREDYGEERIQAFVRDQDGKAYVVVFTVRGENIRIISFRRAHERERKKFDD